MNRLRHLPHSAAVSTILPDISRQAKNGAQVIRSTFGSSSSGKPNELGFFFFFNPCHYGKTSILFSSLAPCAHWMLNG